MRGASCADNQADLDTLKGVFSPAEGRGVRGDLPEEGRAACTAWVPPTPGWER